MARDTLLHRRDQARKARRVEAYAEVRQELRAALAELVPGHRVWVFGSLAKLGRFNDASDVDLALAESPASMSVAGLSVELAERLRRRVDIVMLDGCRFRAKILREGELWTL
jgi:predicted nucleotidyltransferase